MLQIIYVVEYIFRDDMSLQYSPMSEDSDDLRFCETPVHSCSSQPDSLPSSPVSPCRYQRPQNAFSSASSTSLNASHGFTVSAVACSQPRQRGSDSEGRFPSSPSDICHSADLRRAALLRSVQMRTQPPCSPSLELPFGSGQEPPPSIDAEERTYEREYQIEECSTIAIPEPEFSHDNSKPCRVLDMNAKATDSGG